MVELTGMFGLLSVDLNQLTLPAIIVGATIDSINPCAIGVLIFLIAYMTKIFKSRKMMLVGGGLYIGTVYITYFLAGIGLLTAIQNVTIAYYFYWLAAFIAFSAGTLEIKDFLWYGKGFSLQLFPGGAERITMWTKKLKKLAKKSPKMALLATVPIGFGAAAFELPCTGQVYLAILALMRTVDISQWLPLLLLYNFIFVLPLIIITGLMFLGISSHKMENWRKKNRRYMRLIVGLFLYGLGSLILWYIYNEFTYGAFIRPLTFLLFASQVAVIGYAAYKGLFGKN
ncbi:MAG: hypothetical protein HYW24_03650 [Candidatus Aenigmarchaeota archaeon]|nr:hypothetical protein [Candidatus Aenigmarchaeota archaeon]